MEHMVNDASGSRAATPVLHDLIKQENRGSLSQLLSSIISYICIMLCHLQGKVSSIFSLILRMALGGRQKRDEHSCLVEKEIKPQRYQASVSESQSMSGSTKFSKLIGLNVAPVFCNDQSTSLSPLYTEFPEGVAAASCKSSSSLPLAVLANAF